MEEESTDTRKIIADIFTGIRRAGRRGNSKLHDVNIKRLVLRLHLRKIDPNARLIEASVNKTLLHLACLNDKTGDAVAFLLKYGAFVDPRDHNGRTPLHDAAAQGYRSAMLNLLANGANIDAADNFGKRPFHYADPSVAGLLLDKGATQYPSEMSSGDSIQLLFKTASSSGPFAEVRQCDGSISWIPMKFRHHGEIVTPKKMKTEKIRGKALENGLVFTGGYRYAISMMSAPAAGGRHRVSPMTITSSTTETVKEDETDTPLEATGLEQGLNSQKNFVKLN